MFSCCRRCFLAWLKPLTLLALIFVAMYSKTAGQSSTITRSFDFRNGAMGWQSGFADYPPADDKNGFYGLAAGIRDLPSELGMGTGFFIQGNNHSDDLFMFLKRRLDAADGIVAGQTYQVTFTIVFGSNAPSGCGGVGGSLGEGVTLKAGGSPAEPMALFERPSADPFPNLRMNVDKSNQGQSGIAASVAGDIANGQPCIVPVPTNYVSIQRNHQHTSLVNASSRGELWLLVGTDSGFEGATAIYYQQIAVTVVPLSQQPPVLLSYTDKSFQQTGRAAVLDSQGSMVEPFRVLSEKNFLSSDQRTRLNLFAYDLELKAGEDKSVITVEAEDAQHKTYSLPVEAVNEVPNFNWISQVTVKLPDALQGLGTVLISVKLRGVTSNKLPITIN